MLLLNDKLTKKILTQHPDFKVNLENIFFVNTFAFLFVKPLK